MNVKVVVGIGVVAVIAALAYTKVWLPLSGGASGQTMYQVFTQTEAINQATALNPANSLAATAADLQVNPLDLTPPGLVIDFLSHLVKF